MEGHGASRCLYGQRLNDSCASYVAAPMAFFLSQYKEEMERKEKEDIHSGVDFDNCGTSSVQKMAGEDRGNAARLEQQRAQVKSSGKPFIDPWAKFRDRERYVL